jgi:hypothetical protein
MDRTKAEALDSKRWPLAGTMVKADAGISDPATRDLQQEHCLDAIGGTQGLDAPIELRADLRHAHGVHSSAAKAATDWSQFQTVNNRIQVPESSGK